MTNTPRLAMALMVVCAMNTAAQDRSQVIMSFYAKSDFPLTADPQSSQWKEVEGVTAERGPLGDPTPNHRTVIRSRWSDTSLYLLFTCAYEQLYSKPDASTTTETNRLWEWDVSEVFIGSDFQNIKHYFEFQVSPHGEWVDLDIDRNADPPNHNVQWNSGFEVKARIDERTKVWHGEMRIPIGAIDKRTPRTGLEYRINFYRFQGPPPDRRRIAWQPTHSDNYHVPEAFGRLRLNK
jgi:hypothetical protein